MLALKSQEDKIFVLLLIVLFIVFNQNLGLMPLLADEPTRALVSLEMILRNNYIFPTLGGEAYLNKPPLFNWILAGTMYLIKDYKEWHLRLISVIPLFIIAITHYIVISKEVNKKIALWSSIAFLTCGRILFYDSMMAYIDPLFSLFVVLNTYWMIAQSKNPLSLRFFVISYLLCLLAFFLKGLPALSFQACTLLAICAYRKKISSLISLNHLAGIATFLLFTAIYYYEYGAYADTSTLFVNIVSQSSQRTPIATSISASLLHILQFPIQFILDFSPFSFFILFAFRRNALGLLKENEFIFLSLLFICSNIWLYWISSETRARYLFMFLPMFFTIAFYMYEKYSSRISEKIISASVQLICIALAAAAITFIFLERFSFIEHRELISVGLLLLIASIFFCIYRFDVSKMLLLIVVLIVVRITFNFYILPLREKESPESVNRMVGKQIGQITKNERLILLNYAPVNHDILYYLTQERQALVEKRYKVFKNRRYIKTQKQKKGIQVDSFPKSGIVRMLNDTVAVVNDATFDTIQKQIRAERLRERKNLPKGYYICNQLDVVRYELKPVMTFAVTHTGITLALAKK